MLCGKGAAAPLSYAEGWPLAVMFRPQQTEKGVGRTPSERDAHTGHFERRRLAGGPQEGRDIEACAICRARIAPPHEPCECAQHTLRCERGLPVGISAQDPAAGEIFCIWPRALPHLKSDQC
jgi:hypothetical protein